MTIVLLSLGLVTVAGLLVTLRRPSNDRMWKEDQARIAQVRQGDNLAHIQNVRNIRYGAPGTSYEVVWENRTYDLSKVKRLWFIVEPFHPTIKAIAHTFISFEFEDDFLSLSVEARKEHDEEYSIVKGMMGSFELMYCLGDERDYILRRSVYSEHDLYMYPLITPPHEVRAILEHVFTTVNGLVERPRFYNSVRDNCTSALRDIANTVRPGSFAPFILAQVLPGLSDEVLYKKGWIDTTVPFEKLRETYNIRVKAEQCKDDLDFSRRIREL
jgi:Domain of unknown function (DUF4105)